MSEEAVRNVLESMAKIGKHWELGESVGRVWSFLLFKSRPVTQKDIEEGTGYSRGLISRCLQTLQMGQMIRVNSEGKENYYSINITLIESHCVFSRQFLTEKINPIIELLSLCADNVEDGTVRENVLTLRHEFKKLNLAFRIFVGIIEDIDINAVAADMQNVEDYVVTVNVEEKE